MRASFLLVAVSLAIAASSVLAHPVRYIVQLRDSRDRARCLQLTSAVFTISPISQLRLRDDLIGRERWERFLSVGTDDDSSTAETVSAIRSVLAGVLSDGAILSVEPDRELELFDEPHAVAASAEPTDSLFSLQWYLKNSGQEYWGIHRLAGVQNDELVRKTGLPTVDVRLTQTYSGAHPDQTRIIVAIIDSGTDPRHPDLQGQFWRNPDEIAGNGIDDDHNGFVDDTIGYDVSGDLRSYYNPVGDNDITDSIGHGTHIAGIIAARQDARGIVGVSPNALIMPVKIYPNGNAAVGAAGIMYAVNEGARVLNLSWGTPYNSPILQEAISIARDNGVIVCAAIGNSGDASRFYPGAYPEILTVGAMNSSGHTTSFSTIGAPLDLIAPGEDILSLRAAGTDLYAAGGEPGIHVIGPDSLYDLADGTSMACPMVVAGIARVWGMFPQRISTEVEQAIQHSAIDLVDPYGDNSYFPGYDTLSGAGRLNIDGAAGMLATDGIYLTSPADRNRYDGAIPCRVGRIGVYSGGYRLELEDPPRSGQFLTLTSSASLPADSLLFTIPSSGPYSGNRVLRLVDDNGRNFDLSLRIVHERRALFRSPETNKSYNYFVPLAGSFFGPGFDSMTVTARSFPGGQATVIARQTAEFFDDDIVSWELSGKQPGEYEVIGTSWFGSDRLADSARISVTSGFADGWPVKYAGLSYLSPTVADLDNDQVPELVLGTTSGLYAYTFDGKLKPGWPVMTGNDIRTLPAIADLDHDGKSDVVVPSGSGVMGIRYNGTAVLQNSGLSHTPFEENGSNSFGFPIVTVAEMAGSRDSALLYMNTTGNIHAYKFDLSPYYASLGGFYGNLGAPSGTYTYGANSVTSADVDGDHKNEVIATYSGQGEFSGIGVLDARTSAPYKSLASPIVEKMNIVYGTVLADLTGDGLPEIITVGSNLNGTREIVAMTHGNNPVPGFPILLPELTGWRGSWPTVADLDLDGTPEILVTFFEFDVGVLYIFRADGSPYFTADGAPSGQALKLSTTFGPPVVANVTGDLHPEILFRTGYIFPNTGPERLQLYDATLRPIDGWPVRTPSPPSRVFSTIYTPIADDIDGDGLMEIALVGEAGDIFVWDMDAPAPKKKHGGRLFMDAQNSQKYLPPAVSTDVDPLPSLPQAIELRQNYPNPFNPTTTIVYDLPQKSNVRLDIFNLLGQKVTTLVDGAQGAGRYTVRFDGSGLASGVYFYRLTTPEQTISRQMVLVR